MRINVRPAATALWVLLAALGTATLADAQDASKGGDWLIADNADHRAPPPPGAGPGEGGGFGPHGVPGGWGHHLASFGGPSAPPWLHHLRLSESQQDQVFTVIHEAEPALRERFKAIHASREALHKASLQAGTDPAQLRALAEASGKADSELALLMAQTDQKLVQLLTPEQQKSLQDGPPHRFN